MNNRDEALSKERKLSLRQLVGKIISRSWTPGVTDAVVMEKITEIEQAEERYDVKKQENAK